MDITVGLKKEFAGVEAEALTEFVFQTHHTRKMNIYFAYHDPSNQWSGYTEPYLTKNENDKMFNYGLDPRDGFYALCSYTVTVTADSKTLSGIKVVGSGVESSGGILSEIKETDTIPVTIAQGDTIDAVKDACATQYTLTKKAVLEENIRRRISERFVAAGSNDSDNSDLQTIITLRSKQ